MNDEIRAEAERLAEASYAARRPYVEFVAEHLADGTLPYDFVPQACVDYAVDELRRIRKMYGDRAGAEEMIRLKRARVEEFENALEQMTNLLEGNTPEERGYRFGSWQRVYQDIERLKAEIARLREVAERSERDERARVDA